MSRRFVLTAAAAVAAATACGPAEEAGPSTARSCCVLLAFSDCCTNDDNAIVVAGNDDGLCAVRLRSEIRQIVDPYGADPPSSEALDGLTADPGGLCVDAQKTCYDDLIGVCDDLDTADPGGT